MERYVDGDGDAFEQLFHQVAPKLYSYLLRLTRDRERAEDLVQVTFAKVHRARDSYLRGAPVIPWVLAIARRSFYDERRRAKARQEDLTFDGVVPEPKPQPDQVPNDVAESLERALARLPDNYREAIELTKFTGLSVAETAQVLGTTETAVKLRVHRGYNQLRSELERFRRGSP
jgi:RNA polymerase sigma factor (sigma-70 family)